MRTVQGTIQARRREADLERERKAALMQHLFTYGTRGERTKQTEIGEMPESWRIEILGDVAQFKNGINFSRDQKGKGILTVDVLNMYSESVYAQTESLYRVNLPIKEEYLLKPNDVLFVRSSLKQEGVGWPALFFGHREYVTFCGFLIRARLTTDQLWAKFLVYFLRLPSVRSLLVSKSGKVAITNISQEALRTLPCACPSLEEQIEIVSTLDTCEEKITALERETTLLEELFRALLEALMTGRLSALPLAAAEVAHE